MSGVLFLLHHWLELQGLWGGGGGRSVQGSGRGHRRPSAALRAGEGRGGSWLGQLGASVHLVKQGVCCSVLIQDFSPCRLSHSGVSAAAAAQPPRPGGEEAWDHGRPPPTAGTAHSLAGAPSLAYKGWLPTAGAVGPVLVHLLLLSLLSLSVSLSVLGILVSLSPYVPSVPLWGSLWHLSPSDLWVSLRSPPSP